MPKKSTKKWWHEGKSHVQGKAIIRAVAKKYGYNTREEEQVPVDLHELEPELYPKRHIKPYQSDVCIVKGRSEEFKKLAEVDGEYHDPALDAIRDARIFKKYGLMPVRFEKKALLAGEYSESEIAERLGLV